MAAAVPAPRTDARPASRRWLSYSQDAMLVVLSAAFAWSHGQALIEEGRVSSLPFVIEQTILVVLFLVRRNSRHTSGRVSDWIVAAVGTWGTLAMRPLGDASTGVLAVGVAIQAAGVSLAAVAFLNLGRSIGVVAASRGLKTGGLYALVRHPIYTGHVLMISGFLMANPHPWNLAMTCVVFTGLLLRMEAEERLLISTDAYAEYKARVRWRLCPGIY